MIALASEAPDKQTYLQRPDLGRRLSAESRGQLDKLSPATDYDLSIVVADGLSALAAQLHAPAVLASLVPMLLEKRYRLSPLALVRFGRVAVMDSLGTALTARIGLILIGERPGLGAADSLGGYLVFAPAPGKTDADRNCVSNIRPAGLKPAEAAETLFYLIEQINQKQISGVSLKDERTSVHLPGRMTHHGATENTEARSDELD